MLGHRIVYAVLWISLLGTGCATAYRENSADEALAESTPSEAELDDQLTSSRLSEAQLSAFEARAQQKLSDFIDYLNIVGNTSLDSAFRDEAARQAEQLFISPQAEVSVRSDDLKTPAPSVHRLLDALLRAEVSTAFTLDTLLVRQSFTTHDFTQYQGEISFVTSWIRQKEQVKTKHRAGTLVKKVTKHFGEDTEEVWEVFLENIR